MACCVNIGAGAEVAASSIRISVPFSTVSAATVELSCTANVMRLVLGRSTEVSALGSLKKIGAVSLFGSSSLRLTTGTIAPSDGAARLEPARAAIALPPTGTFSTCTLAMTSSARDSPETKRRAKPASPSSKVLGRPLTQLSSLLEGVAAS